MNCHGRRASYVRRQTGRARGGRGGRGGPRDSYVGRQRGGEREGAGSIDEERVDLRRMAEQMLRAGIPVEQVLLAVLQVAETHISDLEREVAEMRGEG